MQLLINIYKQIYMRKIKVIAIMLVVFNGIFLIFSPYGLNYIQVNFSSPTASVTEAEEAMSRGKYVKFTTDNIYYTEYYYGTTTVFNYYIMYSMDESGHLVYYLDGNIDGGERINEFDGPGTKTILLKKTGEKNTAGIIDDIIDNWATKYSEEGFDRDSIIAGSSYIVGEIVYPPSGIHLFWIGAYALMNLLFIGSLIFFFMKSLFVDKDPTFIRLVQSNVIEEIDHDMAENGIDLPHYKAGNHFIIFKKPANMASCVIEIDRIVWGYIHTNYAKNGTAQATVLRLYYEGDKNPHDFKTTTYKLYPSHFVEYIQRRNPEVLFKYQIELIQAWQKNPTKQSLQEALQSKEGTTA